MLNHSSSARILPVSISQYINVDVAKGHDIGQIGTITLVLRRCQVGGMAEDQSNRGCIPEEVDPGAVKTDTNGDLLTHRAECVVLSSQLM